MHIVDTKFCSDLLSSYENETCRQTERLDSYHFIYFTQRMSKNTIVNLKLHVREIGSKDCWTFQLILSDYVN
jgi:hypothetical protein